MTMPHKCEACNGAGRYFEIGPDAPEEQAQQGGEPVVCPWCHGTGHDDATPMDASRWDEFQKEAAAHLASVPQDADTFWNLVDLARQGKVYVSDIRDGKWTWRLTERRH
jgi:DnaJ-class molecular chaperone